VVLQLAALHMPFGTIRLSQRVIGLVAKGEEPTSGQITENVENDP
jgi:hypothetical protein